MRLAHYTFDAPIEFREGVAEYLIIEKPEMMESYLTELHSQTEGFDGNFMLYDNNALDLSKKVSLVLSPINGLNPNTKTVLSNVFKHMKEDAFSELNCKHTDTQIADLTKTIQDLATEQSISLEIEPSFDYASLFKLLNVHFEINADSKAEEICQYLDIMDRFGGIVLFVFVNLCDYLSPDAVTLLISHVAYHKYRVLFIESRVPDQKIRNNKQTHFKIIDRDLCEFSY